MLGFLTDDVQVGYYSAATKIVKMVIGLLTAVSGILLPRFSYYAEGNNRNSFDTLFYKSAIIFWMLCIPMTIGVRARRFQPHLSPARIAKNKFN